MLRNAGAVAAALTLLMAAAAIPALAVGPGLPRTYTVERIDSPQPATSAAFGRAMAGAGDIDRDGKDDLLLSQQANSPGGEGQVFVISGATGARIDTLVAPDAGNPTNAAGNSRAGFGSFQVSKIGSGRGTPGSFTDLASCAGGTSGALCPAATIGGPDGIPEIVVGARGVDPRGRPDAGRVYVFDGATRALLKRIDQPAADTTNLALTRVGNGTNFGRTALNPAGLTACAGNFGVGDCSPGVPRAVVIGDMDGGDRPDLVIGAATHTEDSTTADPTSQCARTPGARCEAAGRLYTYRGEDIVGSSPQEILDGTANGNVAAGSNGPETVRRLRNLDAQADDQSSVNADSEQLGNTLTAIGDVGRCNTATPAPPTPITPGDRCPRANSTTTPDGIPDFVGGAPGADLPLANPDPSFANAGAAYLVDGASGAVLYTYLHPDRQSGANFGSQLGSHEPAAGDLGNTPLPDVFIPAPLQSTPAATRAGRGYVMNGNFKTGTGTILVDRLDDPTPQKGGNFGGGSAGIGDLVSGAAAPVNELLIGVEGFTASPSSDVHFFNPATEKVLQTVPDPDVQPGSAFGGAIVPLGDLNGDGFLDFAASAENFAGSAGVGQGRVYVFRSDNSPLAPVATPTPTEPLGPPAPSVTPEPYVVPTPTPTATPGILEVRRVPSLTATVRPKRDRRRPFRFTTRGSVKPPSGVSTAVGCRGTVRVTVKRKGSGKTLSSRRTSVKASCAFSSRVTFNNARRFGKGSARRRGTLRFSVRFQGNARLLPRAITRTARYG